MLKFSEGQIEDFKQSMDDPARFMLHLSVPYDEHAMVAMHVNRLTLTKTDALTGPLYVLFRSCFNNHQHSAILAPGHKEAVATLKRLMELCDSLPDHIRTG